MSAVAKSSKNQPAVRPRVLVVDDEPNLVELIGDVVGKDMGCRIVVARSLAEARDVLASQPIDLLVTDVHLPDGNGMSLLTDLQASQPGASALVITGAPSIDGAISALREGALDFVPKPFTHQQLVERVRKALDRQARNAREGRRFDKLREAVKRLNASRRVISKKVDLLCNDLVAAYGELSRQLDGVRTQEGFRKYVNSAKDLEQLLCHAMDWLLRQMGYANVAVWLAGDDGEFQLGAYMKYTVAGEPILVDAMKRVILPQAAREGLLRTGSEDLEDELTPQELSHLKGQDILAVNCTYLGESLASLVFFRDARSPFTNEDEALLKSVSPIFAVSLASVVRDAEKEEGDGDHGPGGDHDAGPFLQDGEGGPETLGDGGGLADREPESKAKRKPRKQSDADWWKRGESPPF